MDPVRAPLRPLARSPSYGKSLRVLGLALAAAFVGLLVLAGAFYAAHLVYEPCLQGPRDPGPCVQARLPQIRAPIVAAIPIILAAAMAATALLGASLGLLAAAAHARRRAAQARSRLARLEDAYARGALTERTYAEARAWLTATPPGALARDQARVAMGALLASALLLAPLVVLAWFVSNVPWNNARGAFLPGGGPHSLVAYAAVCAWLLLAWIRAVREAREREPAEREADERLWTRVLEESRERSLAAPNAPSR